MNANKLKDLVVKTKKLKILYVEDNEETRQQALKIFGNFFEYIDVAIDGLDGLSKYKEKDSSFYDLIISDINMPNMNGMDMAEAIFKINRHQNIMVLTAYNHTEYLQELIHIGIKNYIHKPMRMDVLISELEKIINLINTKSKEDEEVNEIQQLNHELDALVDSFDVYVIASRTDLKGNITYASKAYEIISGYSEAELLGKPHSIVRHPDMPAAAFKDMWNTIQDGHLWVGEVKNLKKDGSFYWVEAHIAPYLDSSGSHIGYSAIRLNITSKKRAEALNEEVTNLLNNAGEGFLSFDKSFKISESFSKECLNIFNTVDISEQNISELLFKDDSVKKELFEDGISRVLDSQEDMIKDMFLSLLPKEHKVEDKDISIEYKVLPNDKFMLVLSDITKTKQLEYKIKQQNQIQKMIVQIASNKDDFIEIKYDFENFIANIPKDLKVLLRELHTFKGIFAQKEMVSIVYGIHNLETKINELVQIKDTSIDSIVELVKSYKLEDVFATDLEIISSTLGKEFLNASCSLNIDLNTFAELESKLKKINSSKDVESMSDILFEFEKFKYESVYSMLSIYPSAVKQMAQKLEKEIYPVEIVGDKELKVPEQFKPLMKSLIHLFNNCAEHGIEDMETRVENDKDEIGTIQCKFIQDENNLQITISDNGAGINTQKLSSSAIKNNIVSQEEIDNMTNKEISMLVFADSLSTNDEVSTTSGRGVGMSAIKSEIEALNGTIDIKNNIGLGVEFVFTIPNNK